MKKFLFGLALLTVAGLSFANFSYAKDVYVKGYTRQDGTYVQPHYRSSPDIYVNNNWSTKGNINPYTGAKGTQPRRNEGYWGAGYNKSNTKHYQSKRGW